MSQFRTGGIFKGALLGGVCAGVLNVGLYFAGHAAGVKLLVVVPGAEAMPIPPLMPMVNCVMGGLVAAVVMAVLVKVSPEKAWKWFLGVAVVVFLGFGALPFLALGGDTLSIALLEVMHIPAAIGIMGGIWRFGRARS